MSSKALVLALAGSGCLAAAAGAAYWAPRHATRAPLEARRTSVSTAPRVAAAPSDRSALTPTASTAPAHAAAPKPAAVTTRPRVVITRPADESPAPAPKFIEDPAPAPAAESAAATPAAPTTGLAAAPPGSSALGSPPNDTLAPPSDPEPVVQPPARAPETITIKEDSVIGIRLDQTISAESARVEDRVTARVTRDVRVDGRTAIPEGATLEGSVTLVERGGRFHNTARLGVKFTTLVLADRTRVPLVTDTIYRAGESASNEATAKIGVSAVVGAILGAVVGGKHGAAIGGSAGAAGGAAAVTAGGVNDAVLPAGLQLTVRLSQAVTFVDRN